VERGALRGALSDYRLLALSAVAVQMAVWIDKIVVWASRGAAEASMLASATALAWFTVIPAFAWIYVRVETTFYTAFRRYYRGLDTGAVLAELEDSAAAVRREADQLVRGAAVVQLVVTALAFVGAPYIIHALELPPSTVLSFRFALVGASLQVITLLGLLLLYYLDLRREALRVAVLEVVTIGIATVVVASINGGDAALGAAIGSIPPAAYAIMVVRRAVTRLVPDTFQSQPF
jgi:uncharacterized membrane protein